MSFNLQHHIPASRYKVIATDDWDTTGTTHTVTDDDVKSNSFICFGFSETELPAGRWGHTCSSGSFTITSTDSEAAGLTFSYIIL